MRHWIEHDGNCGAAMLVTGTDGTSSIKRNKRKRGERRKQQAEDALVISNRPLNLIFSERDTGCGSQSGREEKNGMAKHRRAGQGHADMKPRAENARVIRYFSIVFNTARSIGAKSAQTVIWLCAKTILIIFVFRGVKLDLSGVGNYQATCVWLCWG